MPVDEGFDTLGEKEQVGDTKQWSSGCHEARRQARPAPMRLKKVDHLVACKAEIRSLADAGVTECEP
jgi:hypothetical protein